MERRLKTYVDRKFIAYPKTKEILDLKDELFTMLQDKYNDGIKNGLLPKQSYLQALTLMIDFKSAIREVEKGSSLSALKKKLVTLLAFSSFYFIALTVVYLYVSMVWLNSFEKTWLIGVAGSFVYLLYLTRNLLSYAKMFNMQFLSRIMLGALFVSLLSLIYVLPNLILTQLYNLNTWNHSWLVIPVVGLLYLATDYFAFRKKTNLIALTIEKNFLGLLFVTNLYLFFSFIYGLWNIAWIIYVLYLSIAALVFYFKEKVSNKQ